MYPPTNKTNAELIEGLSKKLNGSGITLEDFTYKFHNETNPAYCGITAKNNGHKMTSTVALWFSYGPDGKRVEDFNYYVIAAELLSLHEGRL